MISMGFGVLILGCLAIQLTGQRIPSFGEVRLCCRGMWTTLICCYRLVQSAIRGEVGHGERRWRDPRRSIDRQECVYSVNISLFDLHTSSASYLSHVQPQGVASH